MSFWKVLRAGLCACLMAPAVAADDLPPVEIRPIADGVWVHTSCHEYAGKPFPSNGLIVRQGDGLLLIDTAWGHEQTEQLLAAIKAEIGLPVVHAVATHFHDDRVGGADVLEQAGIDVWGHPLTIELAAGEGNPVPDHRFDLTESEAGAADFYGLEVFYPGHGHAPDNLVVWLKDQGILFGGCAIKALSFRNAGNMSDADPAQWLEALKRLETRYSTARIVVPGHGAEGGIDLISHTETLVKAAQKP